MISNQEFFAVNKVLYELIRDSRFRGYTYYSGSCLRDLWLKRGIKSIDLSVNLPFGATILSNFLTARCGCYVKDKNPIFSHKYGMAQFTLGEKIPALKNIVFNVSTTSKSKKYDKDGLAPYEVMGSVLEDAHNKDFTINSMYMYVQEELKYRDVVGMSFGDFEKRLIRTTVDPDMSFGEDPLRMLRAIRYASELGFGIEKHTWFGICKNAKSILTISDERIQPELNKILVSPYADEAFRKLYYSGLLTYVLPEIKDLAGIEQGAQHNENAFEHSLSVMMKMKPSIDHRLAGLLHDVGKPMTKSTDFYGKIQFKKHEIIGGDVANILLELLGYPKNIVDNVTQAIKLHTRFKNVKKTPSKHNVHKFMKESEKYDMDLCLELIDADNNCHQEGHCKPEQVEQIRKMIAKLTEKAESNKIKLPINGKDIMKNFGIKKGPRIGKAIDLLKEYSYISPKMTKDEALSVISDAIKREQI